MYADGHLFNLLAKKSTAWRRLPGCRSSNDRPLIFNVIRLRSVAINWLFLISTKTSLSSIGACQSTFMRYPNALISTDRIQTYKLSTDGRKLIESCSTDYSTTVSIEKIGHRRLKSCNLTQRTQNWSAGEKKGQYLNNSC